MSQRAMVLTSILILLSCLTLAQDYQDFYNRARKALTEKRYQQFDTLIKKAHELHPYHQTILWYSGVAAALNKRPHESIDFLARAININAGFNLEDTLLDSVRERPEFQSLIKTQVDLNKPVIHSDTAFTIQDRQLHLESVAVDPVDKTLYGGSIYKRKIIKIDSHGAVSDFIHPGQYGMASVFGLRVDDRKRVLWACSSAIPEMQNYDSTLASALFQFDLKTSKLVNSYHPVDTLQNHIFGDLVLDSKGTPYVSDSRNNVIYRYDCRQNKLLPYFFSREFRSLQGLSFSDNDKLLYISDYVKGIFRLDTQTMRLSKVEVPYDLSLKGSDGLLYYKNSLITIQNGVQPNRVVRHFLNASGNSFVGYEYIDNGHPAFGEPTIGSLSGNELFYVANSQWNGYENGKIKDFSDLHPVIILKSVLKDRK